MYRVGGTESGILSRYFDSLIDNGLDFGAWYCGHYHVDRRIMLGFTVLYDDIVRIV